MGQIHLAIWVYSTLALIHIERIATNAGEFPRALLDALPVGGRCLTIAGQATNSLSLAANGVGMKGRLGGWVDIDQLIAFAEILCIQQDIGEREGEKALAGMKIAQLEEKEEFSVVVAVLGKVTFLGGGEGEILLPFFG
ncbi:MAG: hypothetical protein H0T53_08320 [Herpetosiphonaceae bacterium]|nr:hypothetical protein [Herpetosiphonaceae bacterium]